MNFDLTQEQELLKSTVERLAQELAPGKLSTLNPETAWARFAEMGLLGLPFAEAEGGIGGGPVETMIAMEALGGGRAVAPYLECVVLAGALLNLAASPSQRKAILPDVMSGKRMICFAHLEPQARYDLTDIVTTAHETAGAAGFVLNGSKAAVVAGGDADQIIVSARTSGNRFERDGLSLFLIDRQTDGLTSVAVTLLDGRHGADLNFNQARVHQSALIGPLGGAFEAIEQACDVALAASLAESVGVMSAMLTLTVDYLKTRKQFGRKIGEFQALQHRAADMLIATEQARSMAIFSASMAEATDQDARRKAISGAKVVVSQSLRFVSQQAVQLHGGIGVTEEHAIGPFFKRATVLEMFLGDQNHHLSLLAQAGGLLDAST